MPTVKLGTRDEIRLPAEVKRRFKLRKGAKLEVLPLGEGIFIIPAGRIPKDQRYFYTEEWQAKEREADEAIAKGDVKSFSSVEELIRDLRSS